MREIDWAAIDALEDAHAGWRAYFPPNTLGDTYVPGEGGGDIKALIIGEAPGAHEEIKRRPFVGPAGIVLRQLMDNAGLHAATYTVGTEQRYPNCWLTNVVKYRPPGNRTPTETEIKLFRYGLRDEWIAVGKPLLIIPVGGVALRAVMGRPISILRTAGYCHWVRNSEGVDMAVWPMVHPAFGLRNKAVQPVLEADWERLRAWRFKYEIEGL